MALAITLTYSIKAKITTVKSFNVQAQQGAYKSSRLKLETATNRFYCLY
jgi:hypothetical protein